MKKSEKQLATRAAALVLKIEKNKKLYRELDDILCQLHSRNRKKSAKLYNIKGMQWSLWDNFHEKNTQWKSTAFRRFDFTLISAEGK